jgi:hypothetical protein
LSSLAADLDSAAARSARLAPGGRGQQSPQRSVVQSGGIALAFHCQSHDEAWLTLKSFGNKTVKPDELAESLLY